MYKCVDERGVTHFSNKPRPGCKGGEVSIKPQPPVGDAVRPGADPASAENEFRRRRLERETKERAREKALEARKRRCAGLHVRLQRLESGRPIGRINERGERIYMEDAERAEQAASSRVDIAQHGPF